MMEYILLIIFIITSAMSKALADICSESAFYKSKLVTKFNFSSEYWQKSVSSVNKWKNGDKSQGESFWGSSRWFVMFTDGWHLMDFIKIISLIFVGYFSKSFLILLISLIAILTLFELLYSYLKK